MKLVFSFYTNVYHLRLSQYKTKRKLVVDLINSLCQCELMGNSKISKIKIS